MSEKLIAALRGMTRRRRPFETGMHVFHERDPVRAVFLVEDGIVALTRFRADGSPMVLQRAAPGSVLAEASIYAKHYHCDGIAAAPCIVAEVPKRTFLDRFANDPSFAALWATHLAHAVQGARHRSEVLTQKTVAGRLDSWIDWHGALPEKGHWRHLAAEIGVSPEALYRELAKRRA